MRDRVVLEAKEIVAGWGDRPVLNDLSLSLPSGSLCALVGPNGAGKSTLVSVLSGWLKPASGEVFVSGLPLSKMERREAAAAIAVVPQDAPAAFPYTVREYVTLARYPHIAFGRPETDEDKGAVAAALAATDTTIFAERSILELSGGERRRVMLAAAIAQTTPILLLDEPAAGLDLAHQLSAFELLKRTCMKGRTVMAVVHDLSLAIRYADYVAMLHGGRIVQAGRPEKVLTPARIAEVFGVQVAVMDGPDGHPLIAPLTVSAEHGRQS